MKIFDAKHIEPGFSAWITHAKHAGSLCFLFIATGMVAISHVLVPSFLPEFMSTMNARLALKMNKKMCECPDEAEL